MSTSLSSPDSAVSGTAGQIARTPRTGQPASPRAASGQRTRLRADDGRLVRGRRSRARIRQAARELFRERGFDGTTLRAIAELAGMGASSIYRHVRTKEELLVHELSVLQDRAWKHFRQRDDRKPPHLPNSIL